MKFECPHCKQSYEGERSYLGKSIACGNCNKTFIVGRKNVEKKKFDKAKFFKYFIYFLSGSIIIMMSIGLIQFKIDINKKEKEIQDKKDKYIALERKYDNAKIQISSLNKEVTSLKEEKEKLEASVAVDKLIQIGHTNLIEGYKENVEKALEAAKMWKTKAEYWEEQADYYRNKWLRN